MGFTCHFKCLSYHLIVENPMIIDEDRWKPPWLGRFTESLFGLPGPSPAYCCLVKGTELAGQLLVEGLVVKHRPKREPIGLWFGTFSGSKQWMYTAEADVYQGIPLETKILIYAITGYVLTRYMQANDMFLGSSKQQGSCGFVYLKQFLGHDSMIYILWLMDKVLIRLDYCSLYYTF